MLATIGFCWFFSARPAFGQDPPVIVPTRLEFDAARAPKNCNNVDKFDTILRVWVPQTALRKDAEQRLVVRIRWSASGGKRADVLLIDAQGAILAERHVTYAPATECHLVLYELAHEAADLLGAFEPAPPKAPPPEPVVCPATEPCPACPPLGTGSTSIAPVRLTPPNTRTSPRYRYLIGLGAFAGSGQSSMLDFGPYVLLGFVPSTRWLNVHVEIEGAWASPMALSTTQESIRVRSIPLGASLCWVHGTVRFCGGLSTTVFHAPQSSTNDALLLMFGGHFRLGTELFVRGPLAVRADVFGRFALAQQRFGAAPGAIDAPTPFAAGVAFMGAWLLD